MPIIETANTPPAQSDLDLLQAGSGFGPGYDGPPGPLAAKQRHVARQAKGMLQRGIRAALGVVGFLTSRYVSPPTRGLWQRTGSGPAAFRRQRAIRTPHRILLIRTDLLGDLVLTLPAVAIVRAAYPDAQLDLLVQPSTAGILREQPGIDRILLCDPDGWFSSLGKSETRAKLRALIHDLRATRYDLAISVCGDWASILARLSGARVRVGYAGEAFAHLLTDALPGARYQVQQHETAYVRAIALHAVRHSLGFAAITDRLDQEDHADRAGLPIEQRQGLFLPQLAVLPAAMDAVSELLARVGIGADQPIIALHAGSRNGEAKRWPLPYWARLADLLLADAATMPGSGPPATPGSGPAAPPAIILIGAGGDTPLAQDVVRRMRHTTGIYDLTGQTNLPQLAALLARCAVVVTGDSGPLHIAEAVGAPVVAIHGPTDPLQSGPCHTASIAVRRDLWCSPCYDSRATADCAFFNPICMKHLTPPTVYAAVQRQLPRWFQDGNFGVQ